MAVKATVVKNLSVVVATIWEDDRKEEEMKFFTRNYRDKQSLGYDVLRFLMEKGVERVQVSLS